MSNTLSFDCAAPDAESIRDNAPIPSGASPRKRGGYCLPLTPIQKAQRRRQQNAAAKARQRAELNASGARAITIVLDAEAAEMFADLARRQRGPIEGFALRALMTGAKFLANSGNPRGKKVKSNSSIADMSA